MRSYHLDTLTGAGFKTLQAYSPEMRENIIKQADMRAPQVTYCKYNVDHVYKSLKERETHEAVCPEKAAYDKKNAQT